MIERNAQFAVTSLLLLSVEEHLYTSFLSSPASMRTFYAADPQKRDEVKRDAMTAMGLSLAASAFAAWGTRDWRVFAVGAAAAIGFFYLLLRKGEIV
ncbi:MAG: hypothetical protein QXO20_08095 [Candidatus Bathyarchaeia archaeon]